MVQSTATGQQGGLLSGRYRLRERLGAGGMGEVWAAEQLATGLSVAAKLLRPNAAADKEAIARFELEARTLSRIRHENVVRVMDYGFDESQGWFLITELLAGETLGALLSKESRLAPARIAQIGAQILAGLSAAHEAGVVHRDLKPENVMLVPSEQGERVRLLDFGIAKFLDRPVDLTQAGQVFGTPAYISPEQALGQPVDHRADLYACGVILYRLGAGRLPFDAESATALALKHASEEPPPLPDDVPAELAEVIARALRKNPAEREANAAAMAASLQSLARTLGDKRAPSPRPRTGASDVRLTPPRGLNRTTSLATLGTPGAGAVPRGDGISSRTLLAFRFSRVADIPRAPGEQELDSPDELAGEVISAFHGRLVWGAPDGLLAEFVSPTDTLQCAAAIADRLAHHRQPYEVRGAVTAGDVLRTGRLLYGEAVQQAELLTQAAGRGEVLFTHAVYLAMTRSEIHFEPWSGRDPGASQKLYVLRAPPIAPRPELPFGGATMEPSRMFTLRKAKRALRADVMAHATPAFARFTRMLKASPAVTAVGVACLAGLAVVAMLLPWGHAEQVERTIRAGQPAEARKMVDDWLAASPDDPLAHAYRAWLLASENKLDEASELLEQALAKKPDLARHVGVAEALVRVLGRKGADNSLLLRSRTPAVEQALVAGTTSPNYWVRWNSARTLERMGLGEWIDWVEVHLLDVQFGSSCGTRTRAARRLGELGDPRAIPVLEEVRGEKPSGVCNLPQTIDASLTALKQRSTAG